MNINNFIAEQGLLSKRIIIASVIILLMSSILLARIFNLQIVQYDYYSQEALDNQLIFEPIVPIRGKIFDRNGQIIADNKLSYQLTITPEKLNNIDKILAELLAQKILTNKDINQYKKRRKHYKKFQEIPLANQVSEQNMIKVLTSGQYNGLNIRPYFSRIYPTTQTLSHILGYVGRINSKELTKYGKDNYRGINYIGKSGIEKYYESKLKGLSGHQRIIHNANGRRIDSKVIQASQSGQNLYLSIDTQLQKKALDLLGNNRGSVVMMSPSTGEVLVLASAPSFDASLFVDGISTKDYKALQSDKNRPLFNRALSGTYPPGSTIKPLMALAAIENDIIPIDYQVFCKGFYSLPNHSHKYRDWKKSGHGTIGLKDSLAQSCDVFFYNIANKMGIDLMHDYLTQFNLGQKTNIDLPYESAGILPSREWKKHTQGKSWYKGETVIAGIGQGFMTATPLQLAVFTSAIANRGKLVVPKLLKNTQYPNGELEHNPSVTKSFPIKDIAHYESVIDGMKRTIYDKKGTARRLNKNLSYILAGKTGTAQVFGLEGKTYIAENIAKHLQDHALFTGFAPADNPEVTIAVIIENAGSGSAHAAPLAKRMLDAYFANKDTDKP